MNKIQKFLCEVDRHEKIDFWIQKILWLRPYFDTFLSIMDQKMAQAKEVINLKNQFLHARQPHEEIFEIGSLKSCIFSVFCQSFKLLPPFQF